MGIYRLIQAHRQKARRYKDLNMLNLPEVEQE
jgi:hypothetical protein